ncbi:D-alanyl-D-alanine carboxypeptidase/D-alanyl-D-alanine-endopeptidase [uncultured Shimia sp.]|uniref:D-alanyl-D-alanine carboxypeptidase/D-alanyl-D-alanine endopeptidase n=1 Tax=uncultured Shimia sp. TaxID=573152 RepID=UPI0026291251|nr:D-alanyl-D-alanine carboxypeptidase/D-alanyl-D-alanine-endopeptidase [uncultured Shimia sp.]
MVKEFSRRLFLTSVAASISTPVWANPPATSLRPRLRPAGLRRSYAADSNDLIKASGVSGKVGYAVADAKTGLLLEGYEAETGLPPASVTKAVTAMYALDVLGAAHRFETRLLAKGTLSNGVLKGDLVLVGGGDPTLDTNALAGLAKALKQAGVREVTGRFLVWGSALPSIRAIDPGQPDHVGYSPAISGLSLNYNRVYFEWKRASGGGWAVSMDARSDRYRPEVTMAKMRIVKRDLPVYTYQSRGGTDHWTVASGALGNGGGRWLPVRQPEIYAGEVFRTMARAHGIVLKAPKKASAKPEGASLASHKSPQLRDILRDMLRYSTNITAEMVGLSATRARGVKAGSLKVSAGEMNKWASGALGMRNAALVDHSGLGGASRLRAGEMAKALANTSRQAVLQPILKDIKLRDGDGNVKKNIATQVKAKTGTLNFVSGLAGYLKAQDGTQLTFAVFVADTAARRAIADKDKERPKGARAWNRKAKRLQQRLIERWDSLYGA